MSYLRNEVPETQINSNWTATNGISVILNKPTFATVATSGSYVDLNNKPTFATVATTGLYADLLGTKPAAQIQSDWNQTTTTSLDYIKNKPTLTDYVLKTGSTMTGALSVIPPQIAGTVGAVSQILTLSARPPGNDSYLKLFALRKLAGSDWVDVAYRFQHRVDVTDMGYIDFNPGANSQGLAFGNGSTEHVRISSGGNVQLWSGNLSVSSGDQLSILSANKLALQGADYSAVLMNTYLADYYGGLDVKRSGDTRLDASLGVPGTALPLALNASGGKVGIGLTDPLYKLDVNGAIRSTQVGLVGKKEIVHRKPIWGVGSCVGAKTISTTTTADLVTTLRSNFYGPFQYGNPAVATGATRKYRIYGVWGDNAQLGYWKIRLNFIGGGVAEFTNMPITWGDPLVSRDGYSDEISITDFNHAVISIVTNTVGKLNGGGNMNWTLNIEYLEIQSIDQY